MAANKTLQASAWTIVALSVSACAEVHPQWDTADGGAPAVDGGTPTKDARSPVDAPADTFVPPHFDAAFDSGSPQTDSGPVCIAPLGPWPSGAACCNTPTVSDTCLGTTSTSECTTWCGFCKQCNPGDFCCPSKGSSASSAQCQNQSNCQSPGQGN